MEKDKKKYPISLCCSIASLIGPILFFLSGFVFYPLQPIVLPFLSYKTIMLFFMVTSPIFASVGINLGNKQQQKTSVWIGIVGGMVSMIIILVILIMIYKGKNYKPSIDMLEAHSIEAIPLSVRILRS